MAIVRKQKGNETVFDKSLPTKAKPEVSFYLLNIYFINILKRQIQ